MSSFIVQKIPEDRCLTIGERIYYQNGRAQYPLIQKLGCQGSDFMFLFNSERLKHTKTGKFYLLLNMLNMCKRFLCLQLLRHTYSQFFVMH